jgi:hypothetical protein
MNSEELLLLQDTIKKSFRYDAERGRLFTVAGENAGQDTAIMSKQWTKSRLAVRVCHDDPPAKRSKRWKVGVDTIVWWLETGEWVEEAIFHRNSRPDDCRFANLSLEEPDTETKEFFSLIKSVFTYDKKSGKLLWVKGVNKGAEAGFCSPKNKDHKQIVRIPIEYARFAAPTDIRVDSIVWWLVKGKWLPDGLVHKNGRPTDCSIKNLEKPKTRRKSRA